MWYLFEYAGFQWLMQVYQHECLQDHRRSFSYYYYFFYSQKELGFAKLYLQFYLMKKAINRLSRPAKKVAVNQTKNDHM